MAVLVKDIEMPKTCYECKFSYRGLCIANIGRVVTEDDLCPLVEVPEPS